MKPIFFRKRDSDGSQSVYARAFTNSSGTKKVDVVIFSMTSSDRTAMRKLAQELTDNLNGVVDKFYGIKSSETDEPETD